MKDISQSLDINSYGEEACKSAYQYAIKALTKKDFSRFKLKSKIIEKGFEESLAQELVELLSNVGYLREDFYLEARVKGLLHKSYHPEYIKSKMYEENCPVQESDIYKIMENLGVNENSLLENLMTKKNRLIESLDTGKTDQQKKDKILRFVASKGYPPSDAIEILNKLVTQQE